MKNRTFNRTHMHARAEKCEGGYILNGVKTLVTNAPVTDVAVVFAMTAPEKNPSLVSMGEHNLKPAVLPITFNDME